MSAAPALTRDEFLAEAKADLDAARVLGALRRILADIPCYFI